MKEIYTRRNKLKWIWFVSSIVVLCLAGVILYQSIDDSYIFYFVCVHVVVYVITLVIGYGLLRKTNILVSWKFTVNITVAVGGNILINFLLFRLYFVNPLLFIPVVFVLLALLNFALSKAIFAVSNREARLIGALTGLINTLLSMMIGPAFFV